MLNNIMKTLGFVVFISAIFIAGHLVLGGRHTPEKKVVDSVEHDVFPGDSENNDSVVKPEGKPDRAIAASEDPTEPDTKVGSNYAEAKKMFNTSTTLPEPDNPVDVKKGDQKTADYASISLVLPEPDRPTENQYQSAQKRIFLVLEKLDSEKTGR